MAINLLSLSYIVQVAKTGSISKASQNLFLSQPHLSNTIKAVENELGVLLFRRSAKGMIPTNEGIAFLKKATAILSEVDSLEMMFHARPEETTRARLSVTRSYQINRCISEFINQNSSKSNFVLHIRETNPFQVIEDIRTKESELGVLHFFDAQKDYFINRFNMYSLAYKFQYNRPFLLAMSKKSPLAHKAKITKDMLFDQVAVVYGDYEIPSASYAVITEISDILLSRKRVYVYERATAMETLSRCPHTYMWITGLHPETLEREDLVLRRCQDVNVRNLGYSIHLADTVLSSPIKALLKRMEQVDWTETVV